MSAEDQICAWKRTKPTNVRPKDIFKVLDELGFEAKGNNPQSTKRLKGTHGYTAFHPDLEGCPHFPTRRLTICTHSEGRQGQVSIRTLEDIHRAYFWIKRVREEREAHEGRTNEPPTN